MNIIEHGYKIPFKAYPPGFYAPNNKSSLQHEDFVTSSITELLRSKCIEETLTPPFCVNPLTVAEKPKLRLCIDLRHVNKYIDLTKFKYDSLNTVSEMVEEKDYLITFDLKSGYHHVKIHPCFQRYLGFSYIIEGKRRFFKFLVLPFGLSSACFIFTKLMRQLVKKWRSEGKKCAMYIDDGICAGPSLAETTKISKSVTQDLHDAGLTLNIKKSQLAPSHNVDDVLCPISKNRKTSF